MLMTPIASSIPTASDAASTTNLNDTRDATPPSRSTTRAKILQSSLYSQHQGLIN